MDGTDSTLAGLAEFLDPVAFSWPVLLLDAEAGRTDTTAPELR